MNTDTNNDYDNVSVIHPYTYVHTHAHTHCQDPNKQCMNSNMTNKLNLYQIEYNNKTNDYMRNIENIKMMYNSMSHVYNLNTYRDIQSLSLLLLFIIDIKCACAAEINASIIALKAEINEFIIDMFIFVIYLRFSIGNSAVARIGVFRIDKKK